MDQLTTTAPAPGHPDTALLASNLPRWTTERAVEALGTGTPEALTAAIALVERELRPVPRDAEGRKAWCIAIDDRLRRLAAKVAPGMAPAQGDEWRSAMVEALSDLPAMVALTACKRAMHRPFQFLNQVEAAVREIAASVIEEREARRRAAERILRDLERAAAAPPALPRADLDRPVTAEEIRAMPPSVRAMGVKIGAISEADVAAALAADE
jgi:hypothetical protein